MEEINFKNKYIIPITQASSHTELIILHNLCSNAPKKLPNYVKPDGSHLPISGSAEPLRHVST